MICFVISHSSSSCSLQNIILPTLEISTATIYCYSLLNYHLGIPTAEDWGWVMLSLPVIKTTNETIVLLHKRSIYFYDLLSYVTVFKWQFAVILPNLFPCQFVSTRWQEMSCRLWSISAVSISMLLKFKKLLKILLQLSAFIKEKGSK